MGMRGEAVPEFKGGSGKHLAPKVASMRPKGRF